MAEEPTTGLSPQPVASARIMYDHAFEHVRLLKHENIVLADDAEQRLLGLHCEDCHIWWVAPHPIVGGPNNQWPGGLRTRTLAARKTFLEKGIAAAIKAIPPVKKSVWDRIRKPEL